ncbi:MAG: Gfo/Idh/MocA family oxidoreductase [Deltaproteobacteria bacterium]|nr:Gfo/Idh/MocA family oxidoreductase [Deltaproteobacteria bacterium]
MANPTTTIRLGIIGCGKVAWERHLPALLRLPEIRVVATVDPITARSNALGERFGAQHRLSDYRALLELPGIDAVAVLTPTASHAEIGVAALDAGKHLLMEKPVALSLAGCDQLIERAVRSPSKVVVGFNLRWHRLVRRARAFLDSGALGRIKVIRCAYTHDRTGETAPDWHCKLELGGGVTLNEAVHHFDLWRYLTGSDVDQVFSYGNPSQYYEEETCVINGRMSDGALATGVFTLRTAPNSEVEIYGELGRLYLSLYRFDGLEFYPHSIYGGNFMDRLKKTLAAIASLPEAVPILRRGGDFQATFFGLWRHFVDCILLDRPSQSTLEDGKASLRVALAAIKSFRSGRPVGVLTAGSRESKPLDG